MPAPSCHIQSPHHYNSIVYYNIAWYSNEYYVLSLLSIMY